MDANLVSGSLGSLPGAFFASRGVGSRRLAEHALPDKARATSDSVCILLGFVGLGLQGCKASAGAAHNKYTQ